MDIKSKCEIISHLTRLIMCKIWEWMSDQGVNRSPESKGIATKSLGDAFLTFM